MPVSIHNFYRTSFQERANREKPFTAHGCDNFAVFQAAVPGAFCVLPDGYEACHDGFRPYKRDDGKIIGVKVD